MFFSPRIYRSNQQKLPRGLPARRLEIETLEERAAVSTLFGLTSGGVLLQFDSASPTTITSQAAITGLTGGSGERIVGIDFRPRTGQLIGVSVVNTGATDQLRLYSLNPLTGAATQTGSTPISVTAGTFYGTDFNPTVDRLRVVNTADENLRVNPNNGARADVPTNDTDLNPPGSLIDGSAYDRSYDGHLGTAGTTLYDIARNGNSLVLQGGINQSPSPNGGAITAVGPLGFTISAAGGVGFDIVANGTAGQGPAYAVFTDNGTGQTGLYQINLQTGAATLVGLVGDGATGLEGLAAVPESRLVVGSGAGANPDVRVLNGFTGQTQFAIQPFPGFTGGVQVASADVNNDSVADVIVAASTFQGHIKVFDGTNGQQLPGTVGSFFAFQGFTGTVNLGTGDINGDGFADILVSANGFNGHVKGFSGKDGSLLTSFFSYQGFLGGVSVAGADFNNDGVAEIVTAAGSNGHIKVFDATGQPFSNGPLVNSFFAYPGFAGNLSVTAGDINGDGIPDIVTGALGGAGGHVKAFSGVDSSNIDSFFAYEGTFTGGANVGLSDFNQDGRYEIRTTPGAGRTVEVRTFDGVTQQQLDSFAPFLGFQGGATVAGARTSLNGIDNTPLPT
jgi:Domain of unknown function (DUF4394)/FG-GAP-like repeat